VQTRSSTCLTIILACVAACAGASAFAQQEGPGKLPRADQLIAVPVGGTHVPVQKPVEQVKNPYEGDVAAIAQGRQLFQSMNCAGCHAPNGGGAMGPPLSDNEWIYGGEPGQIFMTIMQGRPNGMPSFANALPEESVWKLVAYVRSLSQQQAQEHPQKAMSKQSEQESGKP
jgi:cytochrome c oxidase cbb3-type subunit 3